MMKLKLALFFTIGLMISTVAKGQQLSPNAEISVLTVGPGASLNDAFGHSAFRINDSALGTDIVYGYGEYDFDTPNFYLKFAQGKLNYMMNKSAFSDFYRYYAYYDRTIEEQVLNLTQAQKQTFYEYLQTNYKPENRSYLYDFFYDNCATRMRDVSETGLENNIIFDAPKDFESKTFRELIHEQVGLNTWGSFGIDLALGAVIDQQALPNEHMFLPKYIHAFFKTAKLKSGKNLVKSSRIVYQKKKEKSTGNFLTSPLMIFGLIALIILFITYTDYKNKKRSKGLDLILFTVTGLLGIGMLLLWFATDHTATAQNYNVLWAFPLNLLVFGQLIKNTPNQWFRKYLKLLIILLCLIALHWLIGVQIYAIAILPLLLALAVRYVYLVKYYKTLL